MSQLIVKTHLTFSSLLELLCPSQAQIALAGEALDGLLAPDLSVLSVCISWPDLPNKSIDVARGRSEVFVLEVFQLILDSFL